MSDLTLNPSDAKAAIREEIASLKAGAIRNWGRKSHLLLEVERTGLWQEEAKSFSRWMADNLDHFQVKRASLWRYLSSGHYYMELRQEFSDLKLRPLKDLSSEIGPEKLELLSKISRVAPKETFQQLARKLFAGNSTRPELIAVWETFRPALEGQTSRGRGVEAPKPPKNSEFMRGAIVTSILANTLPTWTGANDIQFHRTFTEVADAKSPIANRLDAVVVVKSHHAGLALHGLEIKDGITPMVAQRFISRRAKCDYMWLVLPEDPRPKDLKTLPETIGVLVVDDQGITVIRQAKRHASVDECAWLTRQLLERFIH